MKIKNRLEIELNVVIVSHKTLPNPITDNLKIFLRENFKINILHITHPLLDTKESFQNSSEYEYLKYRKKLVYNKAFHWIFPWPLLYFKDLIYSFIWSLKFPNKWNLYFGVGNLNPVAGIILRKFGIVRKVVYMSLDYYPIRFKNRFFNWVYFQLDKFCVRLSDETWNVSPTIAKAREKKMNMVRSIYNRQYTVRGGIWFYKTKRLPFAKINRRKIVYRGMLLDHMGVDLVIKAMTLILKKIPDLIFEIVGTGEEEKKLKNLAKNLGVSKNVLFHGFVKGRQEMEKVLSDGAIGIATFTTDIAYEKVRNSDPGKIKDYMLMGMPVVTTNAVYYHKEIAKNRCGLVIDYNPEALASAVIRLLKNKRLLKEYRENATKFIERFDCRNILGPNVKRVINR